MTRLLKTFALLLLATGLLTACREDRPIAAPPPPRAKEVIPTYRLRCYPIPEWLRSAKLTCRPLLTGSTSASQTTTKP